MKTSPDIEYDLQRMSECNGSSHCETACDGYSRLLKSDDNINDNDNNNEKMFRKICLCQEQYAIKRHFNEDCARSEGGLERSHH